jgi:GH25 family lysozyme M1 (1,4-beta-N-acetylmuramidase)
VILGIDLSHHKPGANIRQVVDGGYNFVILKATEGDSFIDSAFTGYLQQCRDLGVPVAAYHYYRISDSMMSQVSLVEKVVPKDVPIILDIERGSGSAVGNWRGMIQELVRRGYNSPLVYIPRWYWMEIGSPSLEGFPPLWASRYVDGIGTGHDLFARVKSSMWSGYGNNFVGMIQFTSSGEVPGCPPRIDVNCFTGNINDLNDLFGKDDDMAGWPYGPEFTELFERATRDVYAAMGRVDAATKQMLDAIARLDAGHDLRDRVIAIEERLGILVGEGVELKAEGSIVVKAVSADGSVASEDDGVADSTT